MTDGGKKNSEMLDRTVPMPVPRGQTKEPTTDEEGAPAFTSEPVTDPTGARPASLATDDTVVRVPAPLDGAPISLEGSFDDEVVNQRVASRPARPMTRVPPRPVPEAIDVMPPPSVPAPLPSSVFKSGPVPVAAPKKLGPEEPTVAVAKAPLADAADAESIPTAPMPMITGMHARDLRDDEPSLPKQRQTAADETSPSRPAMMSDFPSGQQIDSELVGLVIGDGIEPIKRSPPQSAPSPSVADAIFDHTVEHTPAFAPMATEIVTRESSSPSVSSERAAVDLANDETRLKPAPARKHARPVAAVLGAIAGLLVVTAIAIALRSVRGEHEPVPPVGAAPVSDSVNVAPRGDAPAGNAPVSNAPVSNAPVSNAPVSNAPVSDAPVGVALVSKAPVSNAPVGDASVSNAPVGDASVSKAPVGDAPVSKALVGDAPVSMAPVSDAQLSTAPVREGPVGNAPVSKAPVSNVPASKAPVSTAPVTAPGSDVPATEVPVRDVRGSDAPVRTDARVGDAPATTTPSGTRRKDGFGPFVNRSASDAQGLSQALARGVRATLGEAAFTTGKWVGLGVRGEVRRAQAKGKPATASVDCALAIVDDRGARASLSATATAIDEAGRDAALRSAAEKCGRSLESDLRAALDQLKAP